MVVSISFQPNMACSDNLLNPIPAWDDAAVAWGPCGLVFDEEFELDID